MMRLIFVKLESNFHRAILYKVYDYLEILYVLTSEMNFEFSFTCISVHTSVFFSFFVGGGYFS